MSPHAGAITLWQKTHLTWQAFYEQDYIILDKTSGNRNLLDRLLGTGFLRVPASAKRAM